MCLEAQEAIGELKVPSSEGGVNQQINKDLSETLTKTEETACIEDLAAWRLIGDAFEKLMSYYGYQRWDQINIKDFEENLEQFKMSHSWIRYIIY